VVKSRDWKIAMKKSGILPEEDDVKPNECEEQKRITACRNAEYFEEFREEGRRRVHKTVRRDEVKMLGISGVFKKQTKCQHPELVASKVGDIHSRQPSTDRAH